MITKLTLEEIKWTHSFKVNIISDDKEEINYAFDNVKDLSAKDRLIEAYNIYINK